MKTQYETIINNDEEKINYNGVGGRVIHPFLCNKMKEYNDCPYNRIREACLDCDVILTNSHENRSEMDISFVDDE